DITDVPDPAERTALVLKETLHGQGADIVFECAGVLAAINEGLGYLRRGGTFVEMGHFVDVGSLTLNPNQELMRKNLRLEAIWGPGGRENFVGPGRVRGRPALPLAALVTPVPLARVDDAFAALNGPYNLDGRDVVKLAMRGALA